MYLVLAHKLGLMSFHMETDSKQQIKIDPIAGILRDAFLCISFYYWSAHYHVSGKR